MSNLEYKTDNPFFVGFVSAKGKPFVSGSMELELSDETKLTVWSKDGSIVEDADTFRAVLNDVSADTLNETLHNLVFQAIYVRKAAEMKDSFDIQQVSDAMKEFSEYLANFAKT